MKRDSVLLFLLALIFGVMLFAAALLMPESHDVITVLAGLASGATSSLYTLLKQTPGMPDLPAGTVGTQTISTTQTAKSVTDTAAPEGH